MHCLIDMEIVLASKNKNKIKEMQQLVNELCEREIKILSLEDIGFEGDIVEDGASFEENAAIKASVPAMLGYYGIADDSGITVDYLTANLSIQSQCEKVFAVVKAKGYFVNNLITELMKVHPE